MGANARAGVGGPTGFAVAIREDDVGGLNVGDGADGGRGGAAGSFPELGGTFGGGGSGALRGSGSGATRVDSPGAVWATPDEGSAPNVSVRPDGAGGRSVSFG